MPPVRNLLSLWCPLLGTICKCATTIPADEFHTRMSKQPLFERLSFSIRKQVDRNPAFQIDEDRSVAPSAAETKIIHAQHPRRGHLALFLFANEPQERIRTGLQPHPID